MTLKDTTIYHYNVRLKKMDIKDYNDYNEILKKLEFIGAYQTRRQGCSAIIWHLRNTNPESPIILQVQEYQKTLSNKISDNRKKNEFSKQSDIDNFMKWEDIITMRDSISDPLEKLIISLYTYFPTRRRQDYFNFYYVEEEGDETHNYITKNKKLIFNDYKTKNTYGKQVFDCPDEIYNQVIALQYKNGQSIFNLPQDCYMSNFVTNVFKKYCDKHMTIRLLRISFINYATQNPNITYEQREKISNMMAHSVDQQLLYKKNT